MEKIGVLQRMVKDARKATHNTPEVNDRGCVCARFVSMLSFFCVFCVCISLGACVLVQRDHLSPGRRRRRTMNRVLRFYGNNARQSDPMACRKKRPLNVQTPNNLSRDGWSCYACKLCHSKSYVFFIASTCRTSGAQGASFPVPPPCISVHNPDQNIFTGFPKRRGVLFRAATVLLSINSSSCGWFWT